MPDVLPVADRPPAPAQINADLFGVDRRALHDLPPAWSEFEPQFAITHQQTRDADCGCSYRLELRMLERPISVALAELVDHRTKRLERNLLIEQLVHDDRLGNILK